VINDFPLSKILQTPILYFRGGGWAVRVRLQLL